MSSHVAIDRIVLEEPSRNRRMIMRDEYKRLLNIGMDVDHLSALRAGQRVIGFAIAFLVITIIAAVTGYSGVTWAAAGIALAFFVVGLMLVFDSERQRRRDRAPPPVRG